MMFAQITDTHIRLPGAVVAGRSDTTAFLKRCVVRLNGLEPRPDFLLVTGDLVDRGTEAEYAHLKDILAPLEMPVRLALGNHDGRDAFRSAFPGLDYWNASEPFVQYALDAGPVRLVVLDTHDPGRASGALCEARLDWLRGRLAEDRGRPTVVALHHPPIPVGMPGMDAIRLLAGADRLCEILAAAPNVERILAGHLHRPVTARMAGTVLDVMPGTAHQFDLDLGGGRPPGMMFEPPMIQLHVWVEGAGLVSHKIYVDPADGPYPFASTA